MKKAAMCAVGMLMIVMLVGLGASAEAPADPYDDWEMASKQTGQFLEVENEEDGPCHAPWTTEWNVVGSRGGLYTCCGCCPGCVEPETRM